MLYITGLVCHLATEKEKKERKIENHSPKSMMAFISSVLVLVQSGSKYAKKRIAR